MEGSKFSKILFCLSYNCMHQRCKCIFTIRVWDLFEPLPCLIELMKARSTFFRFSKEMHLTFLVNAMIMMFFWSFQLADSNFGPAQPTSWTYFVQWHYLVPEPSLVLIHFQELQGKLCFKRRGYNNPYICHIWPVHIYDYSLLGFLLQLLILGAIKHIYSTHVSSLYVSQQESCGLAALCTLHQRDILLNHP